MPQKEGAGVTSENVMVISGPFGPENVKGLVLRAGVGEQHCFCVICCPMFFLRQMRPPSPVSL